MGSNEGKKSPKSEKVSPSKQEPTNIHLYPDWAHIQAYYGNGVPIPSSYLNSAVMAGQVPHPHLWPTPQTLVPPYGVPYSAIYSPGVFYAHPGVPMVVSPVSTPLLSNSLDNTDQRLTKKLKILDGVATPEANHNAEVDGGGSTHGASQSVEGGIDASSNISDGNTCASQVTEGDANVTARSISAIIVVPENATRKPVDTPNGKADTSMTCAAASAGVGLPLEVWIQDEWQLRRERRKQANRESARRSRIKKQAEIEDIMMRYETLKVQNIALKSEMNQLTEASEKLRVENAALMEKLNGAVVAHPGEKILEEIDPDLAQPNC